MPRLRCGLLSRTCGSSLSALLLDTHAWRRAWELLLFSFFLTMAAPQVWQLPGSTRAMLDARLALRGRPEAERHLAFLLRGLMEWCIYPPQVGSRPCRKGPGERDTCSCLLRMSSSRGRRSACAYLRRLVWCRVAWRDGPQAPASWPGGGPPLRGRKSRMLVSWSCTEESLLALARSRDPLGGLGVGRGGARVGERPRNDVWMSGTRKIVSIRGFPRWGTLGGGCMA
jgi:hypothetical protein